FFFFFRVNQGVHLLVECTGLQHVTVFHFAVTLLKAFELGPALFRRPEEATLSQLFSHGPIQLALPMTGLQGFIKPSCSEDLKKSLGFLIAPVHTCHARIKFKDTRCL
uniref:Uncharacterized protein n=1 Tax=Catagonus wagneri TaxID=51154 RepID=A0A8C3WSQ6_9CETA